MGNQTTKENRVIIPNSEEEVINSFEVDCWFANKELFPGKCLVLGSSTLIISEKVVSTTFLGFVINFLGRKGIVQTVIEWCSGQNY